MTVPSDTLTVRRGPVPQLPARAVDVTAAARRAGLAVLVGAGLATVLIAGLHLIPGFDPVSRMVSDYAWDRDGAVVLPAALLSMAVAIGLLCVGLRRSGLPVRRSGLALLAAAALALVTIAGFPAQSGIHLAGDAEWAADAHRLAGGVLFGALPLAGLVLSGGYARLPAGRPTVRLVRTLAVAAGLAVGVLALGYLPGLGLHLPGLPDLAGARGLTERVILVLETAMVAAMGARLARTAVSGRP